MPALIYVTHHIEEILPLFGKTLVLREGRVLYAGFLSLKCSTNCTAHPFSLVRRKGRYWPVCKMTEDGDQQLANCSKLRVQLFKVETVCRLFQIVELRVLYLSRLYG